MNILHSVITTKWECDFHSLQFKEIDSILYAFGERVKVTRLDGQINSKDKLKQPKLSDKVAALNAANITWSEVKCVFEAMSD